MKLLEFEVKSAIIAVKTPVSMKATIGNLVNFTRRT